MPKNLFIFFAIAAIVSSCKTLGATAPPKSTSTPEIQSVNALPAVTPVCVSTIPTQRDTTLALGYTADLFKEPEWVQSSNVAEGRVSVTWQNSSLGAVVYHETIIFSCGYEEPDLDKYFSDENWKAIFENYQSYELLNKCKRDDGLRLYEFKALNQGFEYAIRYWVQNDTDTRVATTMFVFPAESKSLLDEDSSHLFPGYITCP